MEPRYEVVRVLNDASLIDCESYQRRYRTRDGAALTPGHYVVFWGESVASPAFDEHATYVGPYKTSSLASLGLLEFLRSGAPAAGSQIRDPLDRAAA